MKLSVNSSYASWEVTQNVEVVLNELSDYGPGELHPYYLDQRVLAVALNRICFVREPKKKSDDPPQFSVTAPHFARFMKVLPEAWKQVASKKNILFASSMTERNVHVIIKEDSCYRLIHQRYYLDKKIFELLNRTFDFLLPLRSNPTTPFFCSIGSENLPLFKTVLDFILYGELGDLSPAVFSRLRSLKYSPLGLQISLKKIEMEKDSESECALSVIDEIESVFCKRKINDFIELLKQPSIRMSEDLQQSILEMVVHLDPLTFEQFIVEFLRPSYPLFVNRFLEAYSEKNNPFLEDAILSCQDSEIRQAFIGALPSLENRLLWLEFFCHDAPKEYFREVVILPLIEQKKFDLAIEWVLKKQEWENVLSLVSRLRECHQYLLFGSLQAKITDPICLKKIDKYFEGTREVKLCLKVPQDQIIKGCIHHQNLIFCKEYLPLSISNTIGRIMESHNQSFDGETYNRIIYLMIDRTVHNVLEWLNECGTHQVFFCDYSLHPSLSADFQLLEQAAYSLQQRLCLEFPLEMRHQFSERYQTFFKGRTLLDEVLRAVENHYSRELGLHQSFIIKYVSRYLQPYVMNAPPIEKTTVFLEDFKNDFCKSGFESKWSGDCVETAICVWYQKIAEALEWREALKINGRESHQLPHGFRAAFMFDFPEELLGQWAPECLEYHDPKIITKNWIRAVEVHKKRLRLVKKLSVELNKSYV